MNLVPLAIGALLVGSDPGPIDAFRANYAATKVDLDYLYRSGAAEASVAGGGRLWSARDLGLAADPKGDLAGHWSCDGAVEAFRFGSTASVAAKGRQQPFPPSSRKIRLSYVPDYECLTNGEWLVGHYIDEPDFSSKTLTLVRLDGSPGLYGGSGPYHWWPMSPFTSLLAASFREVAPSRGTMDQGGRPTEYEVYRKGPPGDWRQLEIYYDPAAGYLPRYARLVVTLGPAAVISEFYLIDSGRCAAGGFVPTEWYSNVFKLDRFAADHPKYSHGAVLESRNRSTVGHFRATRFADRLRPAELVRLDGVSLVNAPGGHVKLDRDPASLSLPEIRSLVGPKRMIQPPPLAMGTLDVAELDRFAKPTPSRWALATTLAVATGLVGLALLAWRHARAS